MQGESNEYLGSPACESGNYLLDQHDGCEYQVGLVETMDFVERIAVISWWRGQFVSTGHERSINPGRDDYDKSRKGATCISSKSRGWRSKG